MSSGYAGCRCHYCITLLKVAAISDLWFLSPSVHHWCAVLSMVSVQVRFSSRMPRQLSWKSATCSARCTNWRRCFLTSRDHATSPRDCATRSRNFVSTSHCWMSSVILAYVNDTGNRSASPADSFITCWLGKDRDGWMDEWRTDWWTLLPFCCWWLVCTRNP